MKRARSKPTRKHGSQLHKPAEPQKTPFIEHLHELRKRLFYIAISVIGFGVLAFYFQNEILAVLRYPAGDQIFVTTTPGGAFNFLFSICIATGVVSSIPVMAYQILRYAQPIIKDSFMRTMVWGSFASGVLAVSGVVFGYFFGLPNSLRFLIGQSNNLNIEAMITIDSYAAFVTMYLLGAALLFQVPLILLLINRIKPLKPSQLLRYERPFVVGSLIFGAVISPSPNVQDMLVLAVPTILMYQFSMIMIWIINRKHRRPRKVSQLLKKDAEMQAQRLAKFQEAQVAWQRALSNARATDQPAHATMTAQPALAAAGAAVATQVQAPVAKQQQTPAAAQAAAAQPRPVVVSPMQHPVRRPTPRRASFNDVARHPRRNGRII